MNKQRNISLDIAKAVCTFMVVFLHAGENNAIETYIKSICTCAVPFFFLVSGYYLSLNAANGKTEYPSRQLRKIGELFIISNVLYAISSSILLLIFHDDLAGFWKTCLTCESILNFLVLNDSPFGYHLWYIGAVLYVLLIFNILITKNKINHVVAYMPLLLILAVILGAYSRLFFKNSFPISISCNFITVGLPSMATGYMLKKVLDEKHPCCKYAFKSIIVCSMAIIMERFILHRLGILSTGSIFIMTVPLATSIFIWAATDEQVHSSSVMKFLADLGRYDSANIYIYHMIFILVLEYISISKNVIYIHSKPLLVFVLALILSRGLKIAQNSFLIRSNK
ncbi:MAG: acyltransferase [Lentisphaeria bacterium]|nr:acyltransferase [Lentisphaeria bacterium]